MRTTDDSVTINAPSHTVWEHVERLESLAQWLPVPWSLGLSGKTGAAHVGLEWKSEDLQGIDRLWTIVDAEPPRKLVVHSYVKPESTEGRPWGQPLKKLEGAPLNLG